MPRPPTTYPCGQMLLSKRLTVSFPGTGSCPWCPIGCLGRWCSGVSLTAICSYHQKRGEDHCSTRSEGEKRLLYGPDSAQLCITRLVCCPLTIS
ncbi:hypothetical protein BV22DRAFT_1030752 [Leucogyrophana mollusca]|uniref:Uncharacterized protein n=1 Tax=Leucogyrophana mollusca TaxID=85980 RepID=A0ACB8BRZ7_9AGAM|nr:hypothetical protein BV22DRAFT_1030752 [Leucogyrophana mollusca]